MLTKVGKDIDLCDNDAEAIVKYSIRSIVHHTEGISGWFEGGGVQPLFNNC